MFPALVTILTVCRVPMGKSIFPHMWGATTRMGRLINRSHWTRFDYKSLAKLRLIKCCQIPHVLRNW